MKAIFILIIIVVAQGWASTEERKSAYKLESRGKRNITLLPKVKNKKLLNNLSHNLKEKPKKRNYQNKEGFRKKPVLNRLESLVLLPDKDSNFNNLGVFIGDSLKIEILEDMIGYSGSIRPVRGTIQTGELRGYVVIGNVSMDPKTKELIVIFSKIRNEEGSDTHSIKAEMRLKGRHESKFWTYFWATVAANTAGGFAEASKQQEPSIFGSRNTVTPGNIMKGSISSGLQSGASIFSDELKNYPEFTVVLGPVTERAILSEEPNTL